MKVKTSLFKLDSNIDGTYFDKNGELKVIENMIQSVGAVDGSTSFPASNKLDASLPSTELLDIDDVDNIVNTKGHGILYDKKGKPYAYKGDLVFRDGLGNTVTLNKAITKAHSIYEDGREVFLRDKSLQSFNTSDNGISLDDLIRATSQKATTIGGGNIVQATRNEDTNTNTTSVFTVRMGENNHVWITASAMVNEPTTIQLRDVSTNIILDTARVEASVEHILPIYLSYASKLSVLADVEGVSSGTCNPFIWNTFLKRYFKPLEGGEFIVKSHEIAMEIVEGGNFIKGSINLLAMDDNDKTTVRSGQEIVQASDSKIVIFDEPMNDDSYSIAIQPETAIQTWYEQKTANGFQIRFEREYNGNVFWSTVLTEE